MHALSGSRSFEFKTRGKNVLELLDGSISKLFFIRQHFSLKQKQRGDVSSKLIIVLPALILDQNLADVFK